MKLELISFKICPFVQRSVITLLYKNVPFDITHIDLNDPPAWFREISPFGKVPVLRVDDKYVIFESAVINEFLDESTPGSLLPFDTLRRAIDRSWIDFGTAMTLDLSALMHAASQDRFETAQKELSRKLHWLEKTLENGPYFNGDKLSLVDAAYRCLGYRTTAPGFWAR